MRAVSRNSCQRPELYAEPSILRARVACFSRELALSVPRVLSWAFVQAVLAVLWAFEDEVEAATAEEWLAFARTLREMG